MSRIAVAVLLALAASMLVSVAASENTTVVPANTTLVNTSVPALTNASTTAVPLTTTTTPATTTSSATTTDAPSTTAAPSTAVPTTAVPTPGPTFAQYPGMSHLSFYILCAIVAACYYGILIISVRAVGEGTTALMKPLAMISKLGMGLVSCLKDVLLRRRSTRQYQALEFEDDDVNAPTDGAVN